METRGIMINTIEAIKVLKRHRQHLSAQQFSTIKGQILAGQPEAAMKGLHRIVAKQVGA